MNVNKVVLALFACLNFCQSVRAEEFNSTLKSYCGPDTLANDRLREKLVPWFAQIDLKLQKQPKYQKLVQELHSQLSNNSIVLCWIKLNKNGDIERLALNTTTGSATVDQSIENLVRRSAPFDQPIGNAYPENIQVRIHKAKDLVEITSQLNTRETVKPRIGQNVLPKGQ